MSHVVTIQTQVRDPTAVLAACQRLGLPPAVRGVVQLFSDSAEGLAVELPGWRYPLVCQTATGTLKFDNFNGAWGNQDELDQFMQAYACEKAKLEARRNGHTVTEQALSDGSPAGQFSGATFRLPRRQSRSAFPPPVLARAVQAAAEAGPDLLEEGASESSQFLDLVPAPQPTA